MERRSDTFACFFERVEYIADDVLLLCGEVSMLHGCESK